MKLASTPAVLALALACTGTAFAAPLRDPFLRPALARPAPAPAPEAASAPPRLRALVLGGAQSLANIDGNVLAAGERHADYTVLRIDARGALIERGGRALLLTMQDKDKDKDTP